MSLPCIYGLYDRDGALRYIGKAKCAKTRLAGHLAAVGRKKTPLYQWLAEHGRPDMRIIEADCPDWEEAEKRLIREARERGENLFNVADGGALPYQSLEARQANGRKNAKARQPVIFSLLRKFGQDARFFEKAGDFVRAEKMKHCQDILRSFTKAGREWFVAEWRKRRAVDGKWGWIDSHG